MNKISESYETTIKQTDQQSIKIIDNLNGSGKGQLKSDVLKGLLSTPKYISSKYFYDAKGSKLFEDITKLEEYYPTRTEKSILRSIGNKLKLEYHNLNIIEFGSGDHTKIRLLIKQIPEDFLPTVTYYPIDISRSAVEKSAKNLLSEFPALQISGILTDFMQTISLPDFENRRLFCFLGSTIGNLNPKEAENFIIKIAEIMKSGDRFLLGLDMVKDVKVLNRAYNDGQNITAEFNKNILNVINIIMKTDFSPNDFEHIAFYNEPKQRIEMHLKALSDMKIKLNNLNTEISIIKNELINTEYSYKFTDDDIKRFCDSSGLKIEHVISDENKWFSLVAFRK